MSTPKRHPRRHEAEHLLDDPAASGHALGPVLDAARAPARSHELAREDATVAAFHAARLTPAPISRSNYVSPSITGRRAATRAVIATAAVVGLTTSGIALAATGHLPTLPDQASDTATEAVAKRGTPATGSPTADPTSTESTTEDPAQEPTEGEPTDTEDATAPTPNLEGLCKAYQANDKSAHGKALDSAAFTVLAEAAGSREGIATYCVSLIGEPKETGKPAKPAKPETPVKPTKPAKPETPVKPTKPAKPETPARPENPAKPVTPVEPTKPAKPETPAKPDGAGQR